VKINDKLKVCRMTLATDFDEIGVLAQDIRRFQTSNRDRFSSRSCDREIVELKSRWGR
jgi:hypothetical protein